MIENPTTLRKSIWDYVFYTSLLVLFVWMILKVTGVINTPLWIEYGIPIASIVFTFFASYHGLIDKLMNMQQNFQQQINMLAVTDARIEEHLKHIDKDFDILKRDVDSLKHMKLC